MDRAYRKQAEDGSTLVEVTPSALVHDDYVRFVTDPGAGAIFKMFSLIDFSEKYSCSMIYFKVFD